MHWQTHTVFNQPTPLNNSNLFLSDTALREAVVREGAGWDGDLLASIGQQLGTAESLELGRLANSNPPELLRYDATGARLDDVRFHPAWHLLMQGLCANRVHNLAWQEDAREGAFVARAARFLLHAQVEAGTLCPITMTFAATPLLQHALPAPFRDWLSPLLSDRYDPHLAPGGQKRGLLIGMGMTEKQGGSDVLSNTTRAEKTAEGFYRLVGHKWFFSVPQSDAHLVLAQAPAGLSCFFVPRLLPDGQRNGVRLERLKEKLGNRSNASSEVEFYEACGWLVGDEGDGVRQILRMGGLTRFDCALGSHALMRRAFSVALYHALQRQAFGKNLVEQPMMRQLLGQMALRLEGQTAFLFRLARAWDRRDDARESAWARLFTPAAKFAICGRYPVCRRGDGSAGRHRLLRGERTTAVVSRDAGQQHLGRLRQYYVPRCDAGAQQAAGGDGAAGRGVCGGERTEPPSRPRMASAAATAETTRRRAGERDCPAGLSSWRGGADAAPCFAAAGRSLVPDDARHPRRHTS